MTMTERYGIPPTKIIQLMRSWGFPFRNVRDGDRIVIFTDDGMDPMIWQSAMAGIYERGGEPVLCLYPRRAYHCGDPPQIAISAAKDADCIRTVLLLRALNRVCHALKGFFPRCRVKRAGAVTADKRVQQTLGMGEQFCCGPAFLAQAPFVRRKVSRQDRQFVRFSCALQVHPALQGTVRTMRGADDGGRAGRLLRG